MQTSGFFRSDNHDRIYQSKSIAEFFSQLYSNGIFNNGCQIVSNDDMTVTLKEGYAFINGYWYHNDADLPINISIADANQSRIDNIVLRLNAQDRKIEVEVIEGNYSTNPIAPDLQRNTAYYDIRLAKISVPVGADKITQLMIEDCRFNSLDCGNVVSVIEQIDSTNIFTQYQAIFDAFMSNLEGTLEGNIAANLTNQISSLKNIVAYRSTYTDEELQQPIPISNDILKDNLGNILNPLIPRYERIKEQNTVNGITYIKYNDGKLIQYGTHTYSVSTDAAYFNIGYRSAEYLFGGEVYPVPFVKLDSLQITDNCRTSNSLIMAVRNNNSKLDKLPKITYVTAGRTTPQIAIDCSFIAIGTWK